MMPLLLLLLPLLLPRRDCCSVVLLLPLLRSLPRLTLACWCRMCLLSGAAVAARPPLLRLRRLRRLPRDSSGSRRPAPGAIPRPRTAA